MTAQPSTSSTAAVPPVAAASQAALHPGEQRVLRHMTQLDPLRAFAVIAVMIQHWAAPNAVVALGTVGVRLFFVLSGFLITGILLKCRNFDQSGQTVWYTARQFYLRRFLRIFPLFYLVLLLGYVLNLPPVRETLWWHVLYLSNYYYILHPTAAGATSHFWSLAVEEQFYIVWPWVILLTPQRHLMKVIIATVAIAPVSRLIAYASGANAYAYSYAPYACLDTLGMGALLAAMMDKQFALSPEKVGKALRMFLAAGLAIFAAAVAARYAHVAKVVDVIGFNLGLGLIFTWLIGRAARGFTGAAGAVLTFKPLVFIGAISYGVYVYHNFLWPVFLGAYWKLPRMIRPAMLPALALIIPVISWYAFERPINSLKRYFEYRKKPALN